MQEKTNVMRILDKAKLPYKEYTYDGGALSGTEVAKKLSQDEKKVFKTLAVGEKALSMLKSKDLLPLTGYVHGGCSPIGMKKPFPTTVHSSAKDLDTVIFSGGKIGYQVELGVSDLQKIVKLQFADVICDRAQ